MSWLSKLAAWMYDLLLPWGSWGLAAAAVLDSSLVPFPSGVDLWLITLCVRFPERAPLNILVAAMGSVAGSSILYFVARKGEDAILGKNAGSETLLRSRATIERYGFWALVVAALLPPPAPFKLFVLAAALLRYRWGGFVLALLVGRIIRYSLEGSLAIHYGRQAWPFMLSLGPWTLIGVTLSAVLIYVGLRLRRGQRSKAA